MTKLEAVEWCERMCAFVGFDPSGHVRLLVAQRVIWRTGSIVSVQTEGAWLDTSSCSLESAVEKAVPFWLEQVGLVDALAAIAEES